MQYRINQKLELRDKRMDSESVRQKLQSEIRSEVMYRNTDEAKKRAVHQGEVIRHGLR